MAALQRCMNCGHTDDLSLTNFVCPSCGVQLELLPGEMSMTSIPLCTLKSGKFNHVWRYVTALIAPAVVGSSTGRALWQCDDCHTVVEGRGLNVDEATKANQGQPIHVLSLESPT